MDSKFKIILFTSAAVTIAAGFFIFSSQKPRDKTLVSLSTPSPTDQVRKPIQASFAIFTNGTLRIFTDNKYHNLSTDVYLESSNPDIVQVKAENITWNDFFATLPMKLTKDCLTTGTGQQFCTDKSQTLRFYLNNQQDPDALSRQINQGDKLLVTFGAETESEVEGQLERIPTIN